MFIILKHRFRELVLKLVILHKKFLKCNIVKCLKYKFMRLKRCIVPYLKIRIIKFTLKKNLLI